MKGQIFILVAAFAVFSACTRRQAQAQPRFWHEGLNIEDGRDAGKCSDLHVRASGELAQSTEDFRLSKSQAPTLEVEARSHSSVHVRGWDRPDYTVEVCKFAVAGSRSEAEQRLRSIAVTRTGARLSATDRTLRATGPRSSSCACPKTRP